MIDKDHQQQPVLPEKKNKFGPIFILINLFLVSVSSACSPAVISDPTSFVTSTPEPEKTIAPTATEDLIPDGYIAYLAQSGDTIPAVAAHFGVDAESIITKIDLENHGKLVENHCQDGAPGGYAEEGYISGCMTSGVILDPGTMLYVKDILDQTTPDEILFPDSEVVFSPSVIGFDLAEFAAEQGGYLNEYAELMQAGLVPAVDKIWELAEVHSINPRLLTSIIEQESGWVTGFPVTDEEKRYPLGFIHPERGTVLLQVGWTIRFLNDGYYGWRAGTLTELTFTDGETLRLSPHINAGTAAVMYSMAQIHTYEEWQNVLYGPENLVDTHKELFGDMNLRVEETEPIFPAGITQPELNLPFSPNEEWNLTSGPHPAWGRHGAPAALDFAPPLSKPGCGVSHHWATAAAAGLVVRGVNGSVVLDLDGDGFEQTGWVLVYLHVANTERVEVGEWVEVDEPLGHPSCVGGSSTGIHVHIARKFNGEWVLADGGLPFVLSGYRAYNGDAPYEGTLVRGDKTIIANAFGNFWTEMMRPDSDPKYFYTPTPKS